MTKTICDICGKDVPSNIWHAKHRTMDGCEYDLVNYTMYNKGQRMDICLDCRIEFIDWLNGRKEAVEEAQNEQKALGKIRAEIEQLPDMDKAGVFSSVHMKSMVLDIIDKYYEAKTEGT